MSSSQGTPEIPKRLEIPVVVCFLLWAAFVYLCSTRKLAIGDGQNFLLASVLAALSALSGAIGLLSLKPNSAFFWSLASLVLAASTTYTTARTVLSVNMDKGFLLAMTAIFGLSLGVLYPMLVRWLVHRGKLRLN